MRLEAQQARAGSGTSVAGSAGRSPRPSADRGTPPRAAAPMSASLSPSAGAIAEMPPALDHLLGRAAADAELQPAAADQVGRARILDHVEGVLVAHVDHAGADLDAAGSCADRRQQRETARRAGERNGGRGNRRRPRRAPPRRPRARSTGAARPTPNGVAEPRRVATNGRTTESRSSSPHVSLARAGGHVQRVRPRPCWPQCVESRRHGYLLYAGFLRQPILAVRNRRTRRHLGDTS